ncbi:MAG: polysaccharide biosynthesis C-terminal domain-containing protein [Ferruginibacter sp.]
MINIATILKHNVIGKLLNHVMVFFINILIVRSLGAAGSGSYFNELYLLNFIVFIFSAGLDYAAIALLSEEPALLPLLNKMLFKVVIFFATILSVYVFFLLPQGNHYFRQPAFAIILFSIGNLLLIFYQGILSALKKFNLQNLILGSSNVIFLSYLLIFFKPSGKDAVSQIAITYALLFFVQGLLMYLFSYTGKAEASITVSWNVFIRSGIYIMISSLVYFAFLRVDNFFVEKYASGTTLGNYVQCGKIGQYFLYFSSIISSTLLPFISTETVGASFTEWKKMMKPYIILLCMAALVIALSGKYVFPLLFGNDFTEMYPLMLILLPGFVCLGMLTLLNAVYIGKGNIRKIFVGDITGFILVAGFDAWLVPEYGAYAAAVISSVAYCLLFLYLLSSFKKQFSLSARRSGVNL